MKKLLFLGGAFQQIPAIKAAKQLGLYVITCDYLPQNPGHKFSDQYYNISTTDKQKVLELAKKLNIDGIIAYASDPAAPTAAYVSEKLNLPGNPFDSVNILTQKHLFRQFLQKNNFNCPKAISCKSYKEIMNNINELKFPIMIKPVDSSGSKGVVKVESIQQIKNAFNEAISYSRNKIVIAQEFIVKKGYQVSGDGFSIDGKLVFTSYGNQLYSNKGTRDYVALGQFWPSFLTKQQKEKVDNEIQKLISCLGMKTSAYNIEVILDKDDNVYILQLGPRNGGSYIPQLIKYATDIDLIDYTIKFSVGILTQKLEMKQTKGFWSNYMILSKEDGIFSKISFEQNFQKNNLLHNFCTYKQGDKVFAYKNTSHSLGTILFKANSLNQLLNIINNIENYYKIELK